MVTSIRLRLLIALVVLPVVALVSIGVVMSWSTRAKLDDSFRFTVIPVNTGGRGGLQNVDPDEFLIDVESNPPAVAPNTNPLVYEPETGDAYLLRAEPGFVAAYQEDQRQAIRTLNRNLAVAVALVCVVAAVTAYLLSRRMLGPVESLTGAARRLESGDLKQRVDIQSRDEIGQLGQAFNSMAASLERTESLRKQMTSDVAHELRTPLNNLSGYLDAIADGVVQPDVDVIASLQEEAGLLVRLVGDLQQLALADSGHQEMFPERLQAEELVERAVAAVAKRASDKRITVSTERSSRLPAVEADRNRLGQVIRNLLENAVTYTPDGGTIVVSVRSAAQRVNIVVTDSGPGIPAEHLPFIFERFYRADRARARATGGAGLGLAIVKQIVEAHGGAVTAENGSHGGARLTVSLPAAARMPARARAAEPGTRPSPA
jgi:signal transduction histidine kinase